MQVTVNSHRCRPPAQCWNIQLCWSASLDRRFAPGAVSTSVWLFKYMLWYNKSRSVSQLLTCAEQWVTHLHTAAVWLSQHGRLSQTHLVSNHSAANQQQTGNITSVWSDLPTNDTHRSYLMNWILTHGHTPLTSVSQHTWSPKAESQIYKDESLLHYLPFHTFRLLSWYKLTSISIQRKDKHQNVSESVPSAVWEKVNRCQHHQ